MKRFLPLLASLAISASAADPIKVLIIDGQNNHNWADTTPYLKAQLEKTGKFAVGVSTSPPRDADKEAFDKWRPSFDGVDVVLSNYNGPPWPEHVRTGFEAFMQNGGGLVNVHAANNAHSGWENFEKMTGLLWRNNKQGDRIALDDGCQCVRTAKGEGPGAGHGPQHEYKVRVCVPDHPITKDMPAEWLHAKDELYHGQRGPAEDMNILATAFSDKEKRGTGMHEPMLWWIPFGKGKAVTCVLGHVGRGDRDRMPAMKCVGFVTTVTRSCEWAATGDVTIPIPEDFPQPGAVSLTEE